MSSAGLRNRETDLGHISMDVDTVLAEEYQPPTYTIDLSLPPIMRYQEIARDFGHLLEEVPVLFDEVVQQLRMPLKLIRVLARASLRRLYSKEETEELRGIQQVTGIKMFHLVGFNVLLDLFMGCTSGGVRVQIRDGDTRMLHFRTLDWGMDSLRRIVVCLNFVQKPGGPVIAKTVTYVGYVGVLTGVKKGLSMSLNFRPCHNQSSRDANFRFYLNHILVLLGFRPSISSILRQTLIPSKFSFGSIYSLRSNLKSVEFHLPSIPTTAAYLIFCDGQRTIVVEKDHVTGVVKASPEFLVVTNHDACEEDEPQARTNGSEVQSATLQVSGMDALVEESIDRKGTLVDVWRKATRGNKRGSMRRERTPKSVTEDDISRWMDLYPITNEETHFAALMDPEAGDLLWVARYLEPPAFE